MQTFFDFSSYQQVHILLRAVDTDEVGTHVKGAKERVMAASETTLADINISASK